MKKNFLIIISILIVLSSYLLTPHSASAQSSDQLPAGQVLISFFWRDGCPHCAAEEKFLENLKQKYDYLQIKDYEISDNANRDLLKKLIDQYKLKASTVPVTFVGDEPIVGYIDDSSTGAQIEETIKIHHQIGCVDPTKKIQEQCAKPADQFLNIPFLGRTNVSKLSLPVMTLVLGTLDGFNPCSLWALMMLITVLIATGEKKKIWLVGGSFVIFSMLVYFLFLTAWFNFFSFFGYLIVTKILVGILAVVAGIYFLRDYWMKSKLVCKVIPPKTQKKITSRIENISKSTSLPAILIGIAILAFTVNLVELFCTIGLPAIFTRILTLSDLPTWKYYLYLIFYVFLYELDEIIIVVVAALTLRQLSLTHKYTKYIQLVGGILLIILGAILAIRPELLFFK
jgi:cytochrome c biogenesis protein CcdA/glutaredoxin